MPKQYMITIDVIEKDRDYEDPVIELGLPSIGISVNFRGIKTGTALVCSDKNKLEVIPIHVKEFLERVFKEAEDSDANRKET